MKSKIQSVQLGPRLGPDRRPAQTGDEEFSHPGDFGPAGEAVCRDGRTDEDGCTRARVPVESVEPYGNSRAPGGD